MEHFLNLHVLLAQGLCEPSLYITCAATVSTLPLPYPTFKHQGQGFPNPGIALKLRRYCQNVFISFISSIFVLKNKYKPLSKIITGTNGQDVI